MLWHSALTVSLLATIVVTSGLAVVLFDPAAMTLSWMTTVIFGLTVASGAMFTRTFIEPGRMHPWLRQALLFCALWSVGLSLLHALFPFVARPVQSTLYTAAFAPVIVIFILAVTDALRRGSRTAKFQAIGYVPVILSGIVRLVTGVASSFESNDAMVIFYAGCVFEVLFTTLGVADRFMTLRHQRDQARIEADVQRRLSEHDALTGLFNRRAIEQNFGHYRAEGYRALAVLDLDHFKAINDVHGHASAMRCCGRWPMLCGLIRRSRPSVSAARNSCFSCVAKMRNCARSACARPYRRPSPSPCRTSGVPSPPAWA